MFCLVFASIFFFFFPIRVFSYRLFWCLLEEMESPFWATSRDLSSFPAILTTILIYHVCFAQSVGFNYILRRAVYFSRYICYLSPEELEGELFHRNLIIWNILLPFDMVRYDLSEDTHFQPTCKTKRYWSVVFTQCLPRNQDLNSLGNNCIKAKANKLFPPQLLPRLSIYIACSNKVPILSISSNLPQQLCILIYRLSSCRPFTFHPNSIASYLRNKFSFHFIFFSLYFFLNLAAL